MLAFLQLPWLQDQYWSNRWRPWLVDRCFWHNVRIVNRLLLPGHRSAVCCAVKCSRYFHLISTSSLYSALNWSQCVSLFAAFVCACVFLHLLLERSFCSCWLLQLTAAGHKLLRTFFNWIAFALIEFSYIWTVILRSTFKCNITEIKFNYEQALQATH